MFHSEPDPFFRSPLTLKTLSLKAIGERCIGCFYFKTIKSANPFAGEFADIIGGRVYLRLLSRNTRIVIYNVLVGHLYTVGYC